ncbi:MAG: enoyl-CoA hydratase-related protein [Proteobacteria bacterium]|nr:enoyl-CoA hydratase-related protein [Pseudomonadota bacterium]
MSDTDPILLEIQEGVALVRLNRPEALNALSTPLVVALRDTLCDLRRNNDVRVLLLTGEGRAFCSGADLNDPIMSQDAPRLERGRSFKLVMDGQMNGLLRDLYNFDRPKIAAVNGLAVGGGAGVALAMDMVFAAESAYFMQVFAPNLNLVPDLGCTWHLGRNLGRARAIGLAMTGYRLSAKKAEDWGLIWQSVPDAQLATLAFETAKSLANGPIAALSAVPKIMDAAVLNSLDDQLNIERDVQSALVQTKDFEEALIAFSEKRLPKFTGQ